MPRWKDQAICIRDLDWSETSQVVVLLTETRGKVRGLAKGSKRQSPSSLARFSGGIELLTAGQVVATTRPSLELANITEWDLQRDHFPLRRDLWAQRLAMYAADVCNALLADEDAHPVIFGLLRDLLESLCRSAEGRRAGPRQKRGSGMLAGAHAAMNEALLRFQWGVLDDAGYRPELSQDVRGGNGADGRLPKASAYTFDPVAGGLTAERGVADWRVRSATVEALRSVAAGEAGPTGGPEDWWRANRLLCVYLRSVLDKELPTMSLILGKG